MPFLSFLLDLGKTAAFGGTKYYKMLAMLASLIAIGVISYIVYYQKGVMGHNLGEEVAWGLFIANFTYLVGVAAAAVMLVIPAYIFNNKEIKQVVLMGEVMALAACIMCVTFILASLGNPIKLWHILPGIGKLNLPTSMLAWDVVVINGYMLLNLIIPFYIIDC